MSEWLTFGLLTAGTYAISRAIGTAPAKPVKKIPRRSAPRTAPRQTHAPTVPTIPTTRTEWPTRVPVDTARYAQNSTVETPGDVRPRKSKRHSGNGPFGMNQKEFRAAQKNFRWSVGPEEYDDSVTGWIEGLSEREETMGYSINDNWRDTSNDIDQHVRTWCGLREDEDAPEIREYLATVSTDELYSQLADTTKQDAVWTVDELDRYLDENWRS